MLGFLAAIGGELATNQSVLSQLAGRYNDMDKLIEAPVAGASLFFAFTVVAITFASFAPQVYNNEGPDSGRSFGPFTRQVSSAVHKAQARPLGGVAAGEASSICRTHPALPCPPAKTPWPQAELLNGRAAQIGFAALLVVEAIRGAALF